jgi:hypothetical protein
MLFMEAAIATDALDASRCRYSLLKGRDLDARMSRKLGGPFSSDMGFSTHVSQMNSNGVPGQQTRDDTASTISEG